MALNTYLSKTLLHLLEKGVAKNNLLETTFWKKVGPKLQLNYVRTYVRTYVRIYMRLVSGFGPTFSQKVVFWPNLLSKGCIYEPPKNITLCFR
jgi:hypothetical protein